MDMGWDGWLSKVRDTISNPTSQAVLVWTSTTGNNKLIWEIGIWLNSLHFIYGIILVYVGPCERLNLKEYVFGQSTDDEEMRFSLLLPVYLLNDNQQEIPSKFNHLSRIIGSLISGGGGLCFKRDHLMRKVPTPNSLAACHRSFPRKWSIWGIQPLTAHSFNNSTINHPKSVDNAIQTFPFPISPACLSDVKIFWVPSQECSRWWGCWWWSSACCSFSP